MLTTSLFVYALLLIGGIWSYTSGKLTAAGSITGAIIGFIIFQGTGTACFIMLTLFFIVGSAATKWQQDKKADMNAADKLSGRRTAQQVMANSGVAGILAVLALFKNEYLPIVQLMIAGSFAAATADTLSSEMGTVYGSRFYNIITFKKDTRGSDGVVSMEGTVIGIVSAGFIGLVYALYFGWDSHLFYIVLAGFCGNLADSVLGATLERRGLTGNNTVNFLNTATGAFAAWALFLL